MCKRIPEDWHWVELQDVCQRIKVGLATSVTKYYAESGVPIIRNLNIKQGYFDDSKMLYLQEEFADRHPGKRVKTGDVITVHTGANIGLTCVVPASYAGAHTFTTLIATPEKARLNSEYLTYYINSHQGQAEVQRLLVGGGKNNLNTGDFVRYKLPLPPVREQRKIVDVLSVWDKAITLIEQRIEAARQRKKGLMQRLLTGRVRFPEFEGVDWVTCRMRDLLRETKRPVRWSDEDTYNLISIKRRSGGLFLRQTISGRDIKTKQMNVAQAGDFLISKMQVVHGAWALTPPEFDGMHISNSYIALVSRDQSRLSIEYFDWLSRMPHMYHLAHISSVGVHIEKMRFDLQDFLKHKITIPGDVREQERITAVLDACDREIELLTQKRDALQRQKKGLMQRLLTGRVRVEV